MGNTVVDRLDLILGEEFMRILQGDRLARAMQPGFADVRLYASYLVQTYHYTWHNPRHQALVVSTKREFPVGYAKYCLSHSREEWGHEQMALNDLRSLDFTDDLARWPQPLPETRKLIDYLYEISATGSPYARLGYTFWAERCYGFINSSLKEMAKKLALGPGSMTFLVEHSTIDETHAREVEETIAEFVKTPEDEAAVREVMLVSLKLTVEMMDAVFDNFLAMKTGELPTPSCMAEIL